jgi:hypothetical protein
MAGEPDWVPPGVDTRRANVARVYDYWLGGSHNFLADQDVARAIVAVEPKMREIAQANRQFLGRAVRYLAVAHATEKVYNRSVSTELHLRSRAEIQRFFDGFELVDPGLVYVPLWRPDSPGDVPGDPGQFGCLVGVGRKP